VWRVQLVFRGLASGYTKAMVETRRHNRSLFWEAHERIYGLTAAEELTMFCECGGVGCLARLAVPLSEIRRIRQHPDRFIVQRGHETPEVERIVERAPQWSVVEQIHDRQLPKSSA
jgi:hypothetical protein